MGLKSIKDIFSSYTRKELEDTLRKEMDKIGIPYTLDASKGPVDYDVKFSPLSSDDILIYPHKDAFLNLSYLAESRYDYKCTTDFMLEISKKNKSIHAIYEVILESNKYSIPQKNDFIYHCWFVGDNKKEKNETSQKENILDIIAV